MISKGFDVWILLAFMVSIGNGGEYSGDKVIRLIPKTLRHLKILDSLEQAEPEKYDFWTFPGSIGKSVDIHIKSMDYGNFTKFLDGHGIKYETLLYDIQRVIDHQNDLPVNANDATTDWYRKYHHFEEIVDKIHHLVKENKNKAKVELFSIGKSVRNKELWTVKIKGAPSPNKAIIFINCGIHAREWVSPPTCIYMIDQLINGYGKSGKDDVTEILDKMDFVILPVLNPDGYAFSWQPKRRFWRKNRRPRPRGRVFRSVYCYGVDLNRNFPDHWNKPVGSKFAQFMNRFPCSPIYHGPRQESEIEIQSVVDYLTKLKQEDNLMAYFDIHSYSQMWMLPFGFTKERPPDYDEQRRVGLEGIKAIYKQSGKMYELGSSSRLLYKTTGTTKDFVYDQLKVPYTYVLELRDKGSHGFVLPASQILPTAQEIFQGIKAAVKAMNPSYKTKL